MIQLLGNRSIFSQVVFIFLLTQIAFSQDTLPTYQLPEVNILDYKVRIYERGHERIVFDSVKQDLWSSLTMTDWLQTEGVGVIRGYGNGLLSTLSVRGTNAQNNPILWNGFPIASPFNATPDLSQIPLFSFQPSLIKGANSPAWGSGNNGSSLILHSSFKDSNGIHFGQQIGSFAQSNTNLAFHFQKHNHALNTHFYNFSAKNDFPFDNYTLAGKPTQRQNHARTQLSGVLLNYQFIHKKHIFRLHLWNFENYRQLPPLMTQSLSKQSQQDFSVKGVVSWNYEHRRLKTAFSAACFYDELYYEDSLISLFSRYISYQAFADAHTKYHFNEKISANLQIQYQAIVPKVEGASLELPMLWSRTHLNLFIAASLMKNTFFLSFGNRTEQLPTLWMPLIPFFSIEQKFLKHFTFKSHISKTFRYPTLNDLYWLPGGNPNLQPEDGVQAEATLNFQRPTSYLAVTYYYAKYENLIVWLPQQALWTAQNLNQTLHRGWEYLAKVSPVLNKNWKLRVEASGFYGFAILNKPRFPNDDAFHKQLIYQPLYRLSAQITLQYKNWFFHYVHLFNGKMYTTSDNSEFLPDFQLANIFLLKSIQWKKNNFKVSLQIRNLWNEVYETVILRPMPGRHFLAGIEWLFKTNAVPK